MAAASAGIIPQQAYTTYQHAAPVAHYAAPVAHYASPTVVKTIAQPTLIKKVVEVEAPAHYEFSYDVHDTHTGDIKNQHESRNGDHVEGQYSLIDADGYRRIVDYSSDAHTGFIAHVRREPLEHKVVKAVVAAPTIVKTIAHAPTVVKTVAPVAHYAHALPAAHYSHALPAAHYAAPAYYHH